MIDAADRMAAARARVQARGHLRAAIIAGGGLLLITALVFGVGFLPGSSYRLRGQFASSTNLVPGSVVRTAGVDVGRVGSIEPGPNSTSIIEMELKKSALPVHADTRLSIEPRLVLEGNFYINLEPGSPAAPELESGALIPLRQTTVPVQLDQVLGTFDAPTRSSLTNAVGELSLALGNGRSGAATPGAVPGYRGLRAAVREFDGALDPVRRAARAAQGIVPGDLTGMIRHSRDFTAQLGANPASLSQLITDYQTVVAAFAAESGPLSTSIAKLDGTLRVAPAALSSLNGALPTVTRFGSAALPGLRAAPEPLRQVSAVLEQLTGIARPAELPALLRNLRPVTASLPGLEEDLGRLLPLVNDATQCVTKRVVPGLNAKLEDGPLTTGDPVWLELLHAATGITSGAGGFDGNGSAIRAGLTNGPVNFKGVLPGLGNVEGLVPPISAVRPKWLGFNQLPPFRPDAACVDQPLPEYQAAAGPAPRWASTSSGGQR